MVDSIDSSHSEKSVLVGQKSHRLRKKWVKRAGRGCNGVFAGYFKHESLHIVFTLLQFMKQGGDVSIPVISCDPAPEFNGCVRCDGVCKLPQERW